MALPADPATLGIWGMYGAIIVAVGKWLVPIMKDMLTNVAASTQAAGETLANIKADRDNGYALFQKTLDELRSTKETYETLLAAQRKDMDALKTDWVDMKSRFELLMYKNRQANARLNQANAIILKFGGTALPVDDDDEEEDKPNDRTH